jgi:ArsR family transcriptional regulator
MEEFIKVMKALSEPNRVKIIKILQKRVMCVCEIQAALHLAQPTISKHLKVLEEAGLVNNRKDGLWVNYAIADGDKSPYAATMMGNLKHWLEDDHEMKKILSHLNSIDRADICQKN